MPSCLACPVLSTRRVRCGAWRVTRGVSGGAAQAVRAAQSRADQATRLERGDGAWGTGVGVGVGMDTGTGTGTSMDMHTGTGHAGTRISSTRCGVARARRLESLHARRNGSSIRPQSYLPTSDGDQLMSEGECGRDTERQKVVTAT